MLMFQQGARNRLRATLGMRPQVAFHSPDGSYFFINQEGVFMEKSLGFVPFKGFSRVTGMSFDPGTRKLTINR